VSTYTTFSRVQCAMCSFDVNIFFARVRSMGEIEEDVDKIPVRERMSCADVIFRVLYGVRRGLRPREGRGEGS
jgi:hypothetical protein